MLLAGYVALKLEYNETFSNSAEDLKRAKIVAEEMVSLYGMGERLYGDVSDAIKIIESVLAELKEYLSTHRALLKKIAKMLRDNESITKEQLQREVDAIL